MNRKPYIAGNWKMNLDRRAAVALAAALREACQAFTDRDVAVFPPFVYLDEVARTLAGSKVRVGAQNMCDAANGAFTGEVSAAMLLDVGATSVILGHSERRQLFGETDEGIGRKVRTALGAGLDVILCVGETLDERNTQATERVVGRQLTKGLEDLTLDQMAKVTVAYEPVWAIGTGLNATPKQASDVHTYLRGLLAGLFSPKVAQATRIQYGGSVKPENARDLLTSPDVDGALVGGAALKPDSFLAIARFR